MDRMLESIQEEQKEYETRESERENGIKTSRINNSTNEKASASPSKFRLEAGHEGGEGPGNTLHASLEPVVNQFQVRSLQSIQI